MYIQLKNGLTRNFEEYSKIEAPEIKIQRIQSRKSIILNAKVFNKST